MMPVSRSCYGVEQIQYAVCLRASLATSPLDRQAALGEISASLDKEMKNNELKEE